MTQSGAFLENVNFLRGELTAIARIRKRTLLYMGGEERYPYIYIMDRPRNMKIADDTTLVRKLERQDGAITALDWSADGTRIAVAGASPAVNLYDPETGERKPHAQGTRAGIYTVAFSPDGAQLATGGFDGKVRIYKTSDCTLLHSFIPVPLSAGPTHSAGLTRPIHNGAPPNETPHGLVFATLVYAGPPTLTELQPRGAQKGPPFKLTHRRHRTSARAPKSSPRCPPPLRPQGLKDSPRKRSRRIETGQPRGDIPRRAHMPIGPSASIPSASRRQTECPISSSSASAPFLR